MLLLKDDVTVTGTKYTTAIMQAVQTVFDTRGIVTVITAGSDGHAHRPASLHHKDRALDVRFWDIPVDQRSLVAAKIQSLLPDWYDVVIEKDHFHVEADVRREPKV